jgi:hypothetical protein
MKNRQKKRDTKSFRKSLKNKQMNGNLPVRQPKRNTETIYSVALPGMYEMMGAGCNLPDSEKEIEDALSKENLYEIVVFLDLENGGVQSPFILSIVHNGLPDADTIKDLIMRSLGKMIRGSKLPFMTSDTKITVEMVISKGFGANIYSDYDEYLQYDKSCYEGITDIMLGSLKNAA